MAAGLLAIGAVPDDLAPQVKPAGGHRSSEAAYAKKPAEAEVHLARIAGAGRSRRWPHRRACHGWHARAQEVRRYDEAFRGRIAPATRSARPRNHRRRCLGHPPGTQRHSWTEPPGGSPSPDLSGCFKGRKTSVEPAPLPRVNAAHAAESDHLRCSGYPAFLRPCVKPSTSPPAPRPAPDADGGDAAAGG
jgi:hypothetical protein